MKYLQEPVGSCLNIVFTHRLNGQPEDDNYKTDVCNSSQLPALPCLTISAELIDYVKTVKSYNILASTTKSLRSVSP